MRESTCCFTGHRKLPYDRIALIKKRLGDEIDNLYSRGVTRFISGGALGFDQIAASMVVSKKELGFRIRLVFILPCKNQDERWSCEQKRSYRNLLDKADEIIYVSEEYNETCMKTRNQYMVEQSSYCICALLYSRSGASQTVTYARIEGLRIINVAD